MPTSFDLGGLWVPVITPLTEDGAVDVHALGRLARRLLADGCDGLVALGTTGEPATLRPEERHLVVEACAGACAEAGRPLMVGVGSNCTRSTIDEAPSIEASFAPAALLVIVPYYTRPTEAGVVDHFAAVAHELDTPLVVYNHPQRTGRGLGADSILRIAALPNVRGLKQSVGALDHDTLEILRRKPAELAVLAGDDAYIVPTILMGGAGAIAAAAHVCTSTFVRMVRAATEHDVQEAVHLANSLLPLVEAGSAEPNPACWKAALHAAGEISSPSLRSPMTSASPHAERGLIAAMAGVHDGTTVLGDA